VQAEGSAASIAILNHIADSRLVLLHNFCHWPPFEKPAEWTAQVLAFLKHAPGVCTPRPQLK
jgi:pimeloyl-ACP methyl ester carboxylesterase